MSDATISLVILTAVIILFISRLIPPSVTAVVSCLAFAFCGICTPEEAFYGFSSPTVILVIGMMIVGGAMKETGFSDFIGRKVRAMAGNSERLFIFIAGTSSALLSLFLSNTAVIAVFLPVITSVCDPCEKTGDTSGKRMSRLVLTLPVAMGAMFGGTSTLVGSTPQLTAQGILKEQTGISLGMFDYTLPGLILFAIYMIYVLFIGYPISKRIWKDREPSDDAEDRADKTTALKGGKVKMCIVTVIFAAVVVMFIGGWVEPSLVAACAAVLCIVCGCISVKKAAKSVNVTTVFVLAGCLGLAKGIEKSGVDKLLGDFFSGLFAPEISAIIIFAVFVFAAMTVSNFVTNSTAVVIFLPIALSLCESRGLNPVLFTLGIVFAANLSYSTPLANAQTGMTLVAGYRFSDYIRYTLILDIMVFIAIVVFFPMIIPIA